jgi:hypothetical protein
MNTVCTEWANLKAVREFVKVLGLRKEGYEASTTPYELGCSANMLDDIEAESDGSRVFKITVPS